MTQPDPHTIRQPQLATSDATESEDGEVECLGMTFKSDEERRAYFTEKLREKLRDPEFRAIEGFPIGNDEDILALSDPPYYTACPNPFLEQFLRIYGKPYNPDHHYHREPFAFDVSEGKNDPIYNSHSYHTKVPHKAIMRYILHYTDPGDTVLDGFCGTGMTAVAAELCDDPRAYKELGLTLGGEDADRDVIRGGARHAIASDISPIATFVASNLLSTITREQFECDSKGLVSAARDELAWLYVTNHPTATGECIQGTVLYSVWSDVFICSSCGEHIVAWNVVVDRQNKEMRDQFACPWCAAVLRRRQLERVMTTSIDPITGETYRHTKQDQVLIHYKVGNRRFVKVPDEDDTKILERAAASLANYRVPTCSFEHTSRYLQDGNHIRGITHSHHFYTARNLLALSCLLKHINASAHPRDMLFVFTGFIEGHANRRNRYILDRHHPEGTSCGPLTNTLFVPELQCEVNVFNVWDKTAAKQSKAKGHVRAHHSAIGVSSATALLLPPDSIDYIFIDPPFGKNILYSDLNLLWETWLGVRTSVLAEAIMNERQSKGLLEYGNLMAQAFSEFYKVLKPGRWMTLEFHNSSNSVWVRIQDALAKAGFVVADVRVLDKQQGTIHQDSGYTVKQDLVVSAYKPNGGLEDRFHLEAGTLGGVWDFIRTHLKQLPVFVEARDGRTELVVERMGHRLFDRMVAFHVQRGVAVPLSAPEFYAGLDQRFPRRDDMYFLTDQVAEYERKRLSVREIQQLTIFVKDESTAIQWLRQQLSNKPQTQAELTPQFMRELGAWDKHERLPEMVELLEQNFLRYDGDGPIPAQIVGWMKKSAELRELLSSLPPREDGGVETKSAQLLNSARDRWYVPDPNKAIDLEKLRTKMLLREFAEYASGKGKLKVFRTEAVRAGFAQAWRERDYPAIVRVADRLPEAVLQEDPDLLMYYDNASMRVG